MFINVLTQVLILFVLIVLGAILTKTGILSEKAVKSMTDMVLILVTPCVIIKSFSKEFDSSVLKDLLLSFLITAIAHIGFILLSYLLIHDKNDSTERVLRFAAIFSNCGFMAIPLQQALLGDEGVFYASSYVAIFNLFIWSYGIIMMSGDKKYLSLKKIFINPGIIGLGIGLIIFFFSIPLPKVISEPINYMAGLNTPLPMIIIGYHLMNTDIIKSLKNLKCLYAITLKLVVYPLIGMAVMYLCGLRGTIFVSSVISFTAPVAAITTMFSSKFEKDTAASVNMVSLSTALSLITMPIIITFAQYIA